MVLTATYLEKVKEIIKNQIINNYSYGAIGTGTTAASSSDTQLENEVLRKARQEYTEGSNYIVCSLYVSSVEANGNTITEHGWFDSSSGGNMWNRFVFSGINKTSDIELWFDVKIEWTVEEES